MADMGHDNEHVFNSRYTMAALEALGGAHSCGLGAVLTKLDLDNQATEDLQTEVLCIVYHQDHASLTWVDIWRKEGA
ncbi:hypothetical protein C0Q70_01947 [Pomacea canaliculata]|uniref:Uncharacterized protein n=1 Tax=Pomacea canaliculata TaxID=400727 RepID=A0A2T7Q0Y0_POMCA|nr:hypothetical protein C0Q70_01947 [Pomacea canaliculata]